GECARASRFERRRPWNPGAGAALSGPSHGYEPWRAVWARERGASGGRGAVLHAQPGLDEAAGGYDDPRRGPPRMRKSRLRYWRHARRPASGWIATTAVRGPDRHL